MKNLDQICLITVIREEIERYLFKTKQNKYKFNIKD